MLSKKETQEMLSDSKNKERRKRLKETKQIKGYSLDKFLSFLKDFQNLFSQQPKHHKYILSKGNKL